MGISLTYPPSTGGGNGGGGGSAQNLNYGWLSSPEITVGIYSDPTRSLTTSEWETNGYLDQPIGIESPVGANGFAFTEEGWYQLTWCLSFGFTANDDPLPTVARFSWATWEGPAFQYEIPLAASTDLPGASRSVYGAEVTLASGPFHDPGYGVTAGPSVEPLLLWNGDATITTGGGGTTSLQSIFRVEVTRPA